MPTDNTTNIRIQLAAASEPGDAVTGILLHQLGPEDTIRLAQSHHHEAGIDNLDLDQWRARLLPHLRTDTVSRIKTLSDRHDVITITPEHPEWPTHLNDLGIYAPIMLFAQGNTGLLGRPQHAAPNIAIVGARAATGYGEHVTIEITTDLVRQGHTIVSGAAYGIDGAAHRAALAEDGDTIAFLAGGLDRYYPSGHEALIARIKESGVVASELPPGSAPTKWRFLQRNRLIAALSAATVVVEAGYRSGSLNIAGHALALGRTLAAVPGPATSVGSAGGHRLIQEHRAALVTGADDIRTLLATTPEASALSYAMQRDAATSGRRNALPGLADFGRSASNDPIIPGHIPRL